MKTYQDFQKAQQEGHLIDFIRQAISDYRSSTDFQTALDADEYEAERNVTVSQYTKKIYTLEGREVPDYTSTNHRIASNFFHRLTTQRCAYSLGNGVSFANAKKIVQNGKRITVDETKQKLGMDFDTTLYEAGHFGLIHKVSYLMWNLDHVELFKMTEFCPLFDEYNGALMAGIRFWSVDWGVKPVTVVLYEPDGYTKFRTKTDGKGMDIEEYEPKRAYKQVVAHNDVDPDEVIGESNYSALPIVPLWGSKHKQSDLVGMRAKIDAYDLIKSGFANDLQDCAEIYWIVSNAMGMSDQDLAKFRDRIKLNHVAVADTDNSPITPYTQEIPVNAKETLLDLLRQQIYEDYGALDVHTVAAGATNDHIDAAYQPMDEEADDFEYQVIKCIRGILQILGIDDMPVFNRNRVSNQMERTQMVMLAANYLDDETVLKKLPYITPDEIENIMMNKQGEEQSFVYAETEETEEV